MKQKLILIRKNGHNNLQVIMGRAGLWQKKVGHVGPKPLVGQARPRFGQKNSCQRPVFQDGPSGLFGPGQNLAYFPESRLPLTPKFFPKYRVGPTADHKSCSNPAHLLCRIRPVGRTHLDHLYNYYFTHYSIFSTLKHLFWRRKY